MHMCKSKLTILAFNCYAEKEIKQSCYTGIATIAHQKFLYESEIIDAPITKNLALLSQNAQFLKTLYLCRSTISRTAMEYRRPNVTVIQGTAAVSALKITRYTA